MRRGEESSGGGPAHTGTDRRHPPYSRRPGPFPHGCCVTAASCELDGRPGELRARLYGVATRWRKFLAERIATAQADGDLDADLDPQRAVCAGKLATRAGVSTCTHALGRQASA
ncbi:TetR family transcriptional regulator C-terminal domain-containing protein [Streptomyces glaucescens]|uniref:TetR family transcriptional regulator C-terminal domain-containing protein n=1 Tax=Streptomyces glaucescens TaxID=1907 RepID=UPI00399A6CB1